MENVTFKTRNARKEFESRGYYLKKNKDSECLILRKGREEAQICINKRGLLNVKVKKEVLTDVENVKIYVPRNKNTIMLEMQGKYVDKCRCEIPPKSNRIFW
ncbi:MAG: hypothetical protein HFJ35_02175 [Clostridia bacterium]|nr:hypothetical protein [Clostridia bacterium]